MCNAPVRISEEVAVVRHTTGDSGEKMLAVHRGPERHRTLIVSEITDSATSFLKKFATLSRLFLCRGLVALLHDMSASGSHQSAVRGAAKIALSAEQRHCEAYLRPN